MKKVNYADYEGKYDENIKEMMKTAPEEIDVETMRANLYGFTFTEDYADCKIPDEFYDWLIHREVYIDIWNGIIGTVRAPNPELVTNVDASWGVPNNMWVCIAPESQSVNPEVIFRSDEVIPGVNYKLQLTFAPETREGDNYNNKPGCVKIVYYPNKYGSTGTNTLINSSDVSGTEVTTLLTDAFNVSTIGLDLSIQSRVSNKMATTYNRTLRIAQIRLIPE